MKVLLIEDNPGDVGLIKAHLGEAAPGIELQSVDTLAKGLARMREGCDAILLDLSLPDASGLEGFERLTAEAEPGTPIVVLTGLHDEATGLAAVRRGAQDYLIKDEVTGPLLARALRYAQERAYIGMELARHQKKLRGLASELSLAEERERRRIAGALHDIVGQNLVFARFRTAALLEELDEGELNDSAREIKSTLDQILRDTRELVFELSPPVLYDLGLEAAIEWLTERFQGRYSLQCAIERLGLTDELNEELRVLVFQAVRELLFNVVKHAGAKSALVRLRSGGERFEVSVEDDGDGFEGEAGSGFGLFSIRERLGPFGGELELGVSELGGARVTLSVPAV